MSDCICVYRPFGLVRANSSDTVTMVASLIGENDREPQPTPEVGLTPPSRSSLEVPPPTCPTSGRFVVTGITVSPLPTGIRRPIHMSHETSTSHTIILTPHA